MGLSVGRALVDEQGWQQGQAEVFEKAVSRSLAFPDLAEHDHND